MAKKIAIIGGGISGLVAAVYGSLAGFSVTVYEQQQTAGGECTGWDRDGYHIDNCIHWLMGTSPGSQLYELWKTVGALEGNDRIHRFPAMYTSQLDGQQLTLWRDSRRTEQEMLALSPADSQASSFVMAYGNFLSGDGGIPAGGSRAFAQRIRRRAEGLGARVETGRPVQKILLNQNHTAGILLSNGETVPCDYAVPACDLSVTFGQLLPRERMEPLLQEMYADRRAYPVYNTFQTAIADHRKILRLRALLFPGGPAASANAAGRLGGAVRILVPAVPGPAGLPGQKSSAGPADPGGAGGSFSPAAGKTHRPGRLDPHDLFPILQRLQGLLSGLFSKQIQRKAPLSFRLCAGA
ncbi:MAG: FAD-dependent oxidoreductase [Oscillospiraceae bacterium]|nr:FAD-dependent oxidoreductase [Oscillospiraceae bacterium]